MPGHADIKAAVGVPIQKGAAQLRSGSPPSGYGLRVVRSGAGGIDVGALLAKVEASPPSDAVPAVAAALAETVGAREVNFLIADFSGRAVVRLTSAGPVDGARSRGVDQAERLHLQDPVYGRVLRTKQTDVQQSGNDVCLVVPVTDWYGGQPRDRNTEHGADPDRVSPGD